MANGRGRRGKLWSYTAGHYPHSVRVYERSRGGILYIAAHDPTLRAGRGGERRKSLRHLDKDRAIEYVNEQAAKLRRGVDSLLGSTPSARRILRAYRAHRTPDKGQTKQRRRTRGWRPSGRPS